MLGGDEIYVEAVVLYHYLLRFDTVMNICGFGIWRFGKRIYNPPVPSFMEDFTIIDNGRIIPVYNQFNLISTAILVRKLLVEITDKVQDEYNQF